MPVQDIKIEEAIKISEKGTSLSKDKKKMLKREPDQPTLSTGAATLPTDGGFSTDQPKLTLFTAQKDHYALKIRKDTHDNERVISIINIGQLGKITKEILPQCTVYIQYLRSILEQRRVTQIHHSPESSSPPKIDTRL